jgi:hypothetical protein
VTGISSGLEAGIFGAQRRRTPASRPGLPDLIGWLLRTNRVFAPGVAYARAETFADAFPGGRWPTPVSASTISRWETAVTAPPHATIRRYEQLLGLPVNRLVSVIDSCVRYASAPQSGPPSLRRLVPDDDELQRRLEPVMDLVLTDAVMTGDDWDELTVLVSASPRILVTPSSNWALIANRLVTEMIMSNGVAWLQRCEALNRLLAHPRSQAAAIAACAALGRDTSNQVFTEVVGALDASSHPDAGNHVLSQLRDPTNGRSRYGALLACVRKVRYHHFTEAQLAVLAPLEFEMLRDPASRDEAREIAVELLRHAPATMRESIRRSIRSALGGEGEIATLLNQAHVGTSGSARAVANRIVWAARRDTIRDGGEIRDDILPYVVEDLLFHPIFDVRMHAAFLLGATPYRQAAAAALVAEISGRRVLRDPELSCSVLEALRILGDQAERRVVEDLILSPGLPRRITTAAAATIGHVGGHSSEATWGRMLNALAPTDAGLDAAVYGAGITRVDAVLHGIAHNPRLPARSRASATWWLDKPAFIRDSVLPVGA